jgi:glycolate oxidase iron-sulfur subunit
VASEVSLPVFDDVERPQDDKISACIHCGLCLDKCPTYRTLGTEMDSPRGRVYLIKAVNEGRLSMTRNFIDHMYLCLECRACETACPSHVQFGDLMERARGQIERHVPRPWHQRLLRRLVFRELFPYAWRMEQLFYALRWYQRLGIQALLRRLRVFSLLPSRLKDMEAMLPPLPKRPFTRSVPELVHGQPPATRRTAFFTGCVMNLFYADVHHATGRVLQINGCDVWTPRSQVCCGALHMHAGERELAKQLARRNIAAFERQQVDVIVNNAAGCGAQLKAYGELLEDDPAFAERAHRFNRYANRSARFPNGWPTMTRATCCTPRASSSRLAHCCNRSPSCNSSPSPMPISAAALPASTTSRTTSSRSAFWIAKWNTSRRPSRKSWLLGTPAVCSNYEPASSGRGWTFRSCIPSN